MPVDRYLLLLGALMSLSRSPIAVALFVAISFPPGELQAAEVNPYLPANAKLIVSVNIAQMLESEYGQDQLQDLSEQALGGSLSDFELQLSKHITRITFALLSVEPFEHVTIYEGEFNREKIDDRMSRLIEAQAPGVKVDRTGGVPIYQIDNGDGHSFASFVNYKTLLVAEKREFVSGTKSKLPGTLTALIEQIDERRTAWFVASSELLQLPVEGDQGLKEVDALVGSARLDKTATVDVSLLCKSIAAATTNFKWLKERLEQQPRRARDQEKWDSAVDLLRDLKLVARGNIVNGSTELDTEQIDFVFGIGNTWEFILPEKEASATPKPADSSRKPAEPPSKTYQASTTWQLDPWATTGVYRTKQFAWQHDVGEEVVLTVDCDLKVESRTVRRAPKGSVFVVKDYGPYLVDDAWIWVGDKQGGWITAKRAVSLGSSKEFLSKAIEQDPTNGILYGARATYFERYDSNQDGLADANKWVQLAPSAAAHHIRGNLYLRLGRPEAAVEDYSLAIRDEPQRTLAYVNRGVAWHDLEEYDKAIADFDTAIRLEPNCADAFALRGDSWRKKRNYAKALKDFESGLELESDNVLALGGRAWLRATCPDPAYRNGEQAVEESQKAFLTQREGERRRRPCELSHFRDLRYREIAAAAFAEIGDFEKALACQESMFKRVEMPPAAAKSRHELYTKGMPYREE